jgi:hypothetical protein
MSLFSDVFSLPVYFEFFEIFSYCLHFAMFVCLLKRLRILKQEWQKSPTGTRQTDKLGLVWSIRKKISQITKDCFYLPFFLLIFLCSGPNYLSGDTCTAATMMCLCSPLMMMMRGVIMTMGSHDNDKNDRFANDEWED